MRRPFGADVGDERGAILIQVAVAMVGLLAFSALVIDYGVLWSARRQAQNSADATALSGAISMAFGAPGDQSIAKDTAAATGHLNRVFGLQPNVLTTDITFPTCPAGSPGAGSATCVQANVFRNESRDPLPTFFGRLFGRDVQGVQATATAEILAANSTDCLKPWAVADRWDEFTAHAPGTGGIQYNQGQPDYDWYSGATYTAGTDLYVAPTSTSPGTGFRLFDSNGQLCCDYGLVMQLKGDQPYTAMSYQEIDFGGGNSSAAYRAEISGCHAGTIGNTVNVKPGVSHGPTDQGVGDLIAQDPDAYWYYPGAPPANQPWLATYNPTGAAPPPSGACPNGCIYSPMTGINKSPRIGAIPIITPDDLNACSNCDVRISNILGFFIQDVSGNGNNQVVEGRVVTIPGKFDPSGSTVSDDGSFLKTIILVR